MSKKTIRGKIKNVSLAYAAGGIDADGSISICKVNLKHKDYVSPRFVLEITYTNTCESIVDFYQNTFGGSWKNKQTRDRRDNNALMSNGRIIQGNQLVYAWKITSIKGLNFLEEIEPYLIGKRKQAQIAIKFQKNILNRKMIKVKAGNGLSHRLSDKEISKRNFYHEAIMKLNKHNLSPAETNRVDALLKGAK